jgi:hypothetical protein
MSSSYVSCFYQERAIMQSGFYKNQKYKHINERAGQICQEQICTVSETNCPEGVNDREVIHESNRKVRAHGITKL